MTSKKLRNGGSRLTKLDVLIDLLPKAGFIILLCRLKKIVNIDGHHSTRLLVQRKTKVRLHSGPSEIGQAGLQMRVPQGT